MDAATYQEIRLHLEALFELGESERIAALDALDVSDEEEDSAVRSSDCIKDSNDVNWGFRDCSPSQMISSVVPCS